MFSIFLLCFFSCVIAGESNSTFPIEECPVKTIYPDSPLTSAGFTPNRHEDIWLKPGHNFEQIVFKVWKDRMFDFQPTIPHHSVLIFTRELMNLDESSVNKWIRIQFLITLSEQEGKDTFIMRAYANGRSIYKDTGLWWRVVDIKKIEILVKGEAEVAIDCRPKSVEKDMLENSALKSEPFRYTFWGVCAMLILLTIIASIAILKYCKAKGRKQTLTICGNENMNMRHFSYEDPPFDKYDTDEHIYEEPEVYRDLKNFNSDSKYNFGAIENEYVIDNVNELPLNVPKLTEESVYVQMDLFKK